VTLSQTETKRLIDFVLSLPKDKARRMLHQELLKIQKREPEFVAGVLEYGRRMPYSSEQWFDFLSKVPNILFEDEHWLMSKLSQKQRQQLRLE
jgi:hypothetical protein